MIYFHHAWFFSISFKNIRHDSIDYSWELALHFLGHIGVRCSVWLSGFFLPAIISRLNNCLIHCCALCCWVAILGHFPGWVGICSTRRKYKQSTWLTFSHISFMKSNSGHHWHFHRRWVKKKIENEWMNKGVKTLILLLRKIQVVWKCPRGWLVMGSKDSCLLPSGVLVFPYGKGISAANGASSKLLLQASQWVTANWSD